MIQQEGKLQGEKAEAITLVGKLTGTGIRNAVLYTAQYLTDAQQAQARANIGAGTPYTLPQASPDALGGVKADAVEETDTQPVRIGGDGKLYTAPGGDTSIGITGASAGQIPKVKAVDESGAPTEWTAEADTTPFIVKIGGDDYHGYTSSHTFEEIVAAASAGRVVMAYAEYMYIPGVSASDLFGVYFNLYSTQDVAAFEYTDTQKMIRYGFYVSPVGISASAAYISAKSYDFGGVKADSAEATDTQPVRIGGDGKLYTAPGGGGADISLGISGASAGQVAKVKTVDESGAPTAWEAGDAAGGEEWELINEISTTQWVSSVTINQDSNGNAFSLKKMKIFMTLPKTTNEAGEEQSNPGYALYSVNDRNPAYQNPANGWESALFVWEIEAWGDYCTVTCFKDGKFSSSLHHSDIMVDTGKFSAISKFTWRLFNGTYGWSSTNFKVYGVRA